MKQIMTIFKFTFMDAVRKKAFIFTTIIVLAAIAVVCTIPRFLNSGEDKSDKTETSAQQTEICYVIDESGIIQNGITALGKEFTNIKFESGTAKQLNEYKEQMKSDGKISAISIQEKDGRPNVQIITKDFMSGINSTAVMEVLNKVYVADQLKVQGLTDEMIDMAQSEIPYETEIAGDMNFGGYVMGIVLTLMMFFLVYYYGYGVSMSIATEKTSRVMETLVISAKPSTILIGKCLAMGVVGLAQFGGIIIFSAICFKVLLPSDFMIMGSVLSFDAFTLPTALLIVTYFILGYALYAVMNSVCGASVSKVEDLNSAMMPVMLISLASFYLGYLTTVSSSGSGSMLQKVAMYLPFSAPFSVPFRLLNGDIPTGDIVISIALMVVAIIIVTMVSIRIYSASVLHYGKKLKIGEMLRR